MGRFDGLSLPSGGRSRGSGGGGRRSSGGSRFGGLALPSRDRGGDDLGGAQDRLNRAVEKADEGGLLDWAQGVAGNGLSAGSKVLGGAMDLLDTSKSAVVATALELGDAARAVAGKEGLGDRGNIKDRGFNLGDIVTNTRNNVGVGDVLETNTVTNDLPLNVKRGLGFVGDVVLDPLTYLTAGASVAAKVGRGGRAAVLGRDALATRILNLSDEALAASGATRELADDAVRSISGIGRSTGSLGAAKFDPIRAALGPDVRVGLTFDFGRLGSRVYAPRAAARIADASATARKVGLAKPVEWYTRHGGRRVALDDLVARWEEIPGLRALRRKDPVKAVQMKNEVIGLQVDVENFKAQWARSLEEMKDRIGDEFDPDDLRNAIENPHLFDPEQFPELVAAANTMRVFQEQMLQTVERYIGRELPRLKNYLPHQATLEFLRLSGGDEAFADLMKRRGLSADAFTDEVTDFDPKSIEAIHDAAREAFGQDFVKLFEDDPWNIWPKYIQSLAALMGREGIMGRLQRAGIAKELDQGVFKLLGDLGANKKAATKAARRAERAAAEDASRGAVASAKAVDASQRAKALANDLKPARAQADAVLAELETVTRQMVRQGASLEDAQAAAIRKIVASNTPEKLIRQFDSKIESIESHIQGLIPEQQALQQTVDQADELTRQVGEALGVHTRNEERLAELTESIMDMEDQVGELRLLRERFSQEQGDIIGEAEDAVQTALDRYLESKVKSLRNEIVGGGAGNNHQRNMAALNKAVRQAVKAGADPQTILRAATEKIDLGVDEWMTDLLRGAAARGDDEAAEVLGAIANAEEVLRRRVLKVADGAGQWVPPTEQDELVSRLAQALGAADDPVEQVALRSQLAQAQGQQRFAQIGETVRILKTATDDPKAAAAVAEVEDIMHRAIEAAKREGGGLSAQKRLMRAFFGENEMGQAQGALARALEAARDVSVRPAPPDPIEAARLAMEQADEAMKAVGVRINAAATQAEKAALLPEYSALVEAANDASDAYMAAQSAAFKATTASDPIPTLYHGTSRAFRSGPLREGSMFERAVADNLYGPGFYTTDAIDVAESYTGKGRAGRPAVFEAKIKGEPKVLDLDAPLSEADPDVVAAIDRYMREGVGGGIESGRIDVEEGTAMRLLDNFLSDDTAAGTEAFDVLRGLLDVAGVTKAEADEWIGGLTEAIQATGKVDAMRHTGGTHIGNKPHNVYIWINEAMVDAGRKPVRGNLTKQGAAGMTDDLIQRFETMLLTNATARQAAYEATMKSGIDYTRATQKAEFFEIMRGGVARTQLDDVTEKITNAVAKQDKWIAKKAEAMAIVDDRAAGWPSIGLTPEKIADESRGILALLDEALAAGRRGPLDDEHRELLGRINLLEAELADAGDPIIREMIQVEKGHHLARVKAERQWGKASAWEAKAAGKRAEAAAHWDTAKNIGINEQNVQEYLNAFRHQMQEFTKRNGLWADADIVEMVAAASRIAEPKRAWGLLRVHDEVMARWKAYSLMSPGYHSRNFFSGVWMNGLAGMSNDPAAYYKFGKHWRTYLKQGRKAALAGIKDPEYRRIFADVIDNEGYLFGRTNVRDFVDTIAGATDRGVLGGAAGSRRRRLDPTALDNAAIDRNFGFASHVESLLRGPLYIDSRLKGLTHEESLGQVVKYHFDYSSLGANERKYMKRIIPFYTWTRKNLPLQLEMIAKRPGYYAAYGKAQENLEIGTPVDEIVPSYYGPFAIRSPWTADEMPGGGEAGKRIYWMPDLPFTSLDDLFDPGKLRSQLTPIIKTPWELDRGAQFFSGAPFTGKYKKAPATWGPLLPVLDIFDGRFGLPKAVKVNGDYYLDDRDAYKIEQSLPLLGRLRRLIPTEDKYQARAFSSYLSIIGGLSSQTNTSQAMESELLRRVRIIESRLKRDKQLADAVEEASGGGDGLVLNL